MKKNKEIFMLFVFSCVLQTYFFYLQNRIESPFPYMLGIWQDSNETGFLYMEILAIYIPLYFVVLYFKDYYSFYMENYGRLCLIRLGNRISIVIKLYVQMVKMIISMEIIQWGIWMIWRYDYFVENRRTVLLGMVLFFFILLWIAAAEVCFSTYVKEGALLVLINVYILISMFVHWIFQGKWIIYIFFPGVILKGSKLIQKVINQDLCMKLSMIYIGFMIFLFFLTTKTRFEKRDIF